MAKVKGSMYNFFIERFTQLSPNIHTDSPSQLGKSVNPGLMLCEYSVNIFIHRPKSVHLTIYFFIFFNIWEIVFFFFASVSW